MAAVFRLRAFREVAMGSARRTSAARGELTRRQRAVVRIGAWLAGARWLRLGLPWFRLPGWIGWRSRLAGRCLLAAGGAATLPTLLCAGAAFAGSAVLGTRERTTAALRAAALGWLTAHHVGLSFPAGHAGIQPLGLTALVLLALALATRWATGPLPSGTRTRPAAIGAGLVTVGYAGCAVAVAVAAGTGRVRPSLVQTLVGAVVVAGPASLAGAWAEELAPLARAVLPDWARAMIRGALAAVATLVAGAGLLLAAALVSHFHQVVAVTASLRAGLGGGLALCLIALLLLPNALAWSLAYALGVGFAVGVGAHVSPFGARLGEMPAFSLFAAVPSSARPPLAAWAGLPLAAIAGWVAAVVTRRREPAPRVPAAVAGGAGVLAGVVAGVFAALSGGPLSGGRMATLGPSGWRTGALAAVEMGLVAAALAWALARLAVHHDRVGQHVGEGLPPGVPHHLEEAEAAGEQVEGVQQGTLD